MSDCASFQREFFKAVHQMEKRLGLPVTDDDYYEIRAKPDDNKITDSQDDKSTERKNNETPEVGFANTEKKSPLGNLSFVQQYAKAALDNMEAGRAGFNAKAQYSIPAAFAFFIAIGYVTKEALKESDVPAAFIYYFAAMLLCGGSMLFCRIQGTVLEYTYNYYISTVVHAAIVFRAFGIYNPWCTHVYEQLQDLDRPANLKTAESIHNYRRNSDCVTECVIPKYQKRVDASRPENWSECVIEQWKNRPETLLHKNQFVLGWCFIMNILAIFLLFVLLCLRLYKAVCQS